MTMTTADLGKERGWGGWGLKERKKKSQQNKQLRERHSYCTRHKGEVIPALKAITAAAAAAGVKSSTFEYFCRPLKRTSLLG